MTLWVREGDNEYRPAHPEPGELVSRIEFGPEALLATVHLTTGPTLRLLGLDAGCLRCWLDSQAIDRREVEPHVVTLTRAVIEAGGWPSRRREAA